VVVEKAVFRVGIHLDVVLDARRMEHRVKAIGITAQSRPPIRGAETADDRADVRQGTLCLVALPWLTLEAEKPCRRVPSSARMDIRLRPPLRRLPALKLLHVENDDAARSGAGRAALEALWVPGALLPDRGVEWRAESDDVIVATWDVPPERPELHISIGPEGAVTSYRAQRWSDSKSGYVPFGAEVHVERTFGGATIPSRITAGWGHGTPSWAPFFRGEVVAVEPIDSTSPSDGR
jgi:hypothetical protein